VYIRIGICELIVMSLRVFIHQYDEEGSPLWRHTEYILSVYHNGLTARLRRRYSEIRALWEKLSLEFPELVSLWTPFPEKTVFSTSKSVVASRVEMFNDLFRVWTSSPQVSGSNVFRDFLECGPEHSPDPEGVYYPAPVSFFSVSRGDLSSPPAVVPSLLPLPTTPPCLKPAEGISAACSSSVADEKTEKIRLYQSDESIMCPILARPMYDAAVAVPCGHSFSEEGILEWMRRSPMCPSCRGHVSIVLPNYSLRNVIGNIVEHTPLGSEISIAQVLL